MLRLILLLSFLFLKIEWSFAIASQENETWQTELQSIDQELGRLDGLKGKYSSSAARKEAEGNRVQFDNKLDARKAYAQAEAYREIVIKIESRMAYLQARKSQILMDHPVDEKKP